MWSCFKSCVRDAFSTIAWYTLAAIVAALIALFAGGLATGGAAAGVAVVLFEAVSGVVATYFTVGALAGLTAIISGLVACLLKCIF